MNRLVLVSSCFSLLGYGTIFRSRPLCLGLQIDFFVEAARVPFLIFSVVIMAVDVKAVIFKYETLMNLI